MDASNRYEFTAKPAKSGKFVELKSGSGGLNIAEVEVYGTLGLYQGCGFVPVMVKNIMQDSKCIYFLSLGSKSADNKSSWFVFQCKMHIQS